MVPSTLGAVVAFGLLILPGVMFREFRQRASPPVSRSPLADLSTIIVASAALNLAAAGITALAGRLGVLPRLSLRAWAGNSPSYVAEHVEDVLVVAGATVLVGAVLAVAAHRVQDVWPQAVGRVGDVILGRRGNVRSPLTPWQVALDHRSRLANGQAKAMVTVLDEGGWQYHGQLAVHSDAHDDRTLVIGGEPEVRRPDGVVASIGCDVVVVPPDRLRAVYVTYVQAE